jgi:phosphohistidine phosphatase
MALLELYLVRHGLAGKAQVSRDDRLRPLTRAGVRRTRAAAILHAAGLAGRPTELACLAPGGDLQDFLGWLGRWRHRGKARLALVGHMPDLTDWAERLLVGKRGGRLVLKKAGVLGLTLPSSGTPLGRSSLFLLAPPRYLL